MDGVTILSVVEPAGAINIFTSILIVGTLAGFLIGTIGALAELEPSYSVIGLAIGMVLGVFFGSVLSVVATEKTPRYKVTISEEVNFQEFHNTYDIISQEGEIYTVKLK